VTRADPRDPDAGSSPVQRAGPRAERPALADRVTARVHRRHERACRPRDRPRRGLHRRRVVLDRSRRGHRDTVR